jgi:hypothetical protein
VKKLGCVFFPSFRRKPESSIFNPLTTSWTPVFTGVTAEKQFFYTFPNLGGEAEEISVILAHFLKIREEGGVTR